MSIIKYFPLLALTALHFLVNQIKFETIQFAYFAVLYCAMIVCFIAAFLFNKKEQYPLIAILLFMVKFQHFHTCGRYLRFPMMPIDISGKAMFKNWGIIHILFHRLILFLKVIHSLKNLIFQKFRQCTPPYPAYLQSIFNDIFVNVVF